MDTALWLKTHIQVRYRFNKPSINKRFNLQGNVIYQLNSKTIIHGNNWILMTVKEFALEWTDPFWPALPPPAHLMISKYLVSSAIAFFLIQICNFVFVSAILNVLELKKKTW